MALFCSLIIIRSYHFHFCQSYNLKSRIGYRFSVARRHSAMLCATSHEFSFTTTDILAFFCRKDFYFKIRKHISIISLEKTILKTYVIRFFFLAILLGCFSSFGKSCVWFKITAKHRPNDYFFHIFSSQFDTICHVVQKCSQPF